jgi:mucin-19
LDVTGTVILTTDIITTGAQSYENIKFATSNDRISTLQTNNADITINGTVDGVQDKMQSSVIDAGTGVVTLGGSIGSIARLNDFTVTGSRINILADILTGMTQTYNGPVYIGDASYIGRPATVGFLYERSYIRYFENDANTAVVGSSIAKLNSNPIYVRTLISVDPSITFNDTVNDTVPNTHTLLLAAIADHSVPASAGIAAINNAASINFNAAVGDLAPLYSLNAQVRVNLTQADGASSFIGQVNVKDGVSTYSDQVYRANAMFAQASLSGGEITFSVFDPQASVTFNLPRQTADNSGCSGASCGQFNLQNPGSLDSLRFNGDSNYLNNQNMSGTGRWGSTAIADNALGYVPPPVTQALRSNLETGSVLKQALQLMLASNEGLANTGSKSRVDVSMTSDAISASSERDRIGSGEFRMMASNQIAPVPEKGFVNVIFKLVINGTSIQLVSSSPQKGFELKLPPMALPKLDALLQQQMQDGVVKPVTISATLADGRPLPSWLTFNPETQTFSASSIPEGTPDTQVKLQVMQDGKEVDQVVFTIDTP